VSRVFSAGFGFFASAVVLRDGNVTLRFFTACLVCSSKAGNDTLDWRLTVSTPLSCLLLIPQDLKIELGHRGAVSDAARNGEAVVVRAGVGGTAPSMLCMPVYGADGLVAGVVQVVGKKSNGKSLDSG